MWARVSSAPSASAGTWRRYSLGVNPLMLVSILSPFLSDFVEDWAPELPEPMDIVQCADDRCAADDLEDPSKPGAPPKLYPVIDVEERAANVCYRNGKVKRTRWKPVDLSKRIVVIGLHQAGVERSEGRWGKTAHKVTCHRAIGPAGNRYKVHPLDRRLVCTNRVDRAPYHCIGIEVLGNFEGDAGQGNWYKPDRFGYGQLGAAQLEALRQEIESIVREVEAMGGVVVGILPHRTVGRNKRGKPNRPICCGSAIWSGAGEWAGAELGLAVPGKDWALGGLPVKDSWHGEFHERCDRLLAA